MSICETSITNSKKQLEFYKDLSEQLQQENQELKKQLHEASIEIQSLIEENMSCPSSCSKIEELKSQKQEWVDLLDKFKTQQKEFIEYLEAEKDRLARECSQIYEDSLGKTRLVSEDIFNELNDVLSKYKKIVGYKE